MTDIVKIREEHFENGKNPHQIAKEMGISWTTAKSYISKKESSLKELGKRPNRKTIVGGPEVIKAIQDHLQEEIKLKIHRKQKVTATALFNILKSKNVYNGNDRYFRKLFAKEVKSFKGSKKTYLELDFPLGQYLQFDHGPLEISYQGQIYNAYLFCASVPQYSLRYCQVYLKKSFESWGDFHEKAFKFFGGVFPNCIYDNDSVLKIATKKEQTNFSLELEAHYNFNSIFCNKAAGWEKGAVENAVGTCRRNFLSGRPVLEDLAVFNNDIEEKCHSSINEGQHYKTKVKLLEYLSELQENKSLVLRPMPLEHDWGLWIDCIVDSRQYIRYQNVYYSVPQKYVDSILKVHVTSYSLKIYCDNELVFKHKRQFIAGKDSLEIDHFIEQLEKKPRAIKFSKVLKKTDFPEYILELRDRLRNRMDEQRANLQFIKIMKLKRICTGDIFETAIRLGFAYGGVTSEAIESFISQLQFTQLSVHSEDIKLSLPEKCQKQVDIKNDFNLNDYLELCAPNGGYIQ